MALCGDSAMTLCCTAAVGDVSEAGCEAWLPRSALRSGRRGEGVQGEGVEGGGEGMEGGREEVRGGSGEAEGGEGQAGRG